jgi:electron transfer flavoprotein alpha subunit
MRYGSDASVFKNADYGVVADWRETVPALIEEIRRRKEAGRSRES